ncbi:MAG: Deoxyribodipyrimidine photo-lyase [candidate division WS6 bacterium OLB20]|uniref:Deoxyribodipyrimidine photo-lyase n=1 Tax=candidate division WS6 bacterium OLB20 TaxID=1617426 RepID=A0A136LXT2_9BACT|nr:MAG: Deoxyribodipyrimidine photo-lyase [candidate division WS6 bacterium OLB20]
MIEQRIQSDNRKSPADEGPVVYWASRDLRTADNAALWYAQQLALRHNRSLCVLFRLHSSMGYRSAQHFDFMLAGLQEFAQALGLLGIGFLLVTGDDVEVRRKLLEIKASALILDFSPLRGPRKTADTFLKSPFTVAVVDAHNIVPVHQASAKQEYAARTIRPKITGQLDDFLSQRFTVSKHPVEITLQPADWEAAYGYIAAERPADLVIIEEPGEQAGKKQLAEFIDARLHGYAEKRNDPADDMQSGLSPYFHFGMLSAADAVRAVSSARASARDKAAFIEEAVVRKELSDNFCYYNPLFDSLDGAPDWAQKTLAEHSGDIREHVYSYEEFNNAETHDPAWNAAQKQMATTGKMHGYMRMYWAKKDTRMDS